MTSCSVKGMAAKIQQNKYKNDTKVKKKGASPRKCRVGKEEVMTKVEKERESVWLPIRNEKVRSVHPV
jgi:hypothetical protein